MSGRDDRRERYTERLRVIPSDGPLLALLPPATGLSVVRSSAKTVSVGGQLVQVAANLPAVDAAGLLVESVYTNYVADSGFRTAWSSQSDGTPNTVTTDATDGPDGAHTASLLTFNTAFTGGNWSNVTYSAASLPGVGVFTFSVWLKAGTLSSIPIEIRGVGSLSGNAARVCALTSSWQRFVLTGTIDGDLGNPAIWCHIGSSGVYAANTFGTGTVYAAGAQLELSPYAHSLALTAGSTATTDKDVVTVSAPVVLPVARGSLSLDFAPEWSQATNTPALFDSRDGNDGRGICIDITNGNAVRFQVGGSVQCTYQLPSVTPGAPLSLKMVWSPSGTYGYLGGALVASNATAPVIADHATAHIGNDYTGGGQANGHLANVLVLAA